LNAPFEIGKQAFLAQKSRFAPYEASNEAKIIIKAVNKGKKAFQATPFVWFYKSLLDTCGPGDVRPVTNMAGEP